MTMSHEMPSAPASPRVARKREVRGEAIVDAAMALVATEGLDALTLGRVASSLGYVPAALYRYFGSKDALLAAMQRRAIGEIDEALRQAEASLLERAEKRTPEIVCLASILTASQVYAALPVTHPRAYFLVAVLLGDPRLLLSMEEAARTAPLLTASLGRIHARLEEASALGALAAGDATLRTLSLWGALQGSLLLEKARRIAPALPEAGLVCAASTQAMLLGWGAKPAQLTRASHLSMKVSLG
jgi:AcrR family transcriptional regulator